MTEPIVPMLKKPLTAYMGVYLHSPSDPSCPDPQPSQVLAAYRADPAKSGRFMGEPAGSFPDRAQARTFAEGVAAQINGARRLVGLKPIRVLA